MTAAWRLAVALMLGPPVPGEVAPPAPTIEPEPAAPIEGPAPPPSTDEQGIEFAVQPPEDPTESDPVQTPAPEPSWPTPGTAPTDGWGAVVSGAILMPVAALATWGLYREAGTTADRVGILVGGIGLELVGVGLISMGLYRRAKLYRWTLAYRVVAPPQGAGLLAAGGLAVLFGGTLIGTGGFGMARGNPVVGGTLLGVGVASVAVIAPLTIYLGKRRRDHYLDTGGWYRPPMPTVQLSPRVIVTGETFGFGVAGRF